ncbi:MAG: hypothetical protein H6607_04130 [Flavobacteriales bacterium]|nr:hypothetical protein [Flavobacteriales bacterium]
MSIYVTYPKELEKEVMIVMAKYPELQQTFIHFKWGKIAAKSFMLAQPQVASLLRHRSKREYQIIMKERFFTHNKMMENGRVPSEVIVGWLAHELGHILDYKDRSSWNLAWFGVKYYFLTSFLKKAEITADHNAVKHGFIDEIVVSKEFGRNPKYFPKDYIAKLNRLYPSVKTVKEWAKNLIGG